MSQTTKNLNILITRLDEELTTQINRAAEAERDLSFAREDLAEARASLLASRTLADRNEDFRNEDFIRAREENERLYMENSNLRKQLDKYTDVRMKEAGEWLRDTDPLALTIEINKILSESYSGSRSCDPFTEKIPVIKAVRTKWDLGLKESKDVVDAWFLTHPVGGIEQFQAEDR